ncbi:MAG: hypothetical protein GY705_04835 [Bacteroidetes bacterium]|nr:hypothetical protein [Bacteroidota bacterium]
MEHPCKPGMRNRLIGQTRSISSLVLETNHLLRELLAQIKLAHLNGEFSYTLPQYELLRQTQIVMNQLLAMDVTPSQMPQTIEDEVLEAIRNEDDDDGKYSFLLCLIL